MEEARKLKFQQKLIFLTLFLGYTMYILDRKSFAFNIPNIKEAENLDAESIGSIISSLAIGYALGKFLCGVLVDSTSPKYLFSTGLLICGLVNLAFSVSSTTSAYASLWFLNGLVQGCGWPSCAKLLKSWYSPTVFGTLWSLLSASMNVAASVGPFLCNALIDSFGSWRYCMQVFGMSSVLAATFVVLFVNDKPTDAGFSTDNVEKILKGSDAINEVEISKQTNSSSSFLSAMKRIFSSPYLYVISCGFLTCLLCKGVFSDWGPLYLITEKKATKTIASAFVGTMEIGGILGSVLSGAITDRICILMPHEERGNPRNYYFIPCVLTLAVSVMLLRTSITDVSNQYSFALLLAFLIGYCVYSILSVVGVMTIERSADDISGRSHAVAALFGNVGLTLSGLPFSMIVEKYSWSSAFFILECCLCTLLVSTIASQYIRCRIGDTKQKDD